MKYGGPLCTYPMDPDLANNPAVIAAMNNRAAAGGIGSLALALRPRETPEEAVRRAQREIEAHEAAERRKKEYEERQKAKPAPGSPMDVGMSSEAGDTFALKQRIANLEAEVASLTSANTDLRLENNALRGQIKGMEGTLALFRSGGGGTLPAVALSRPPEPQMIGDGTGKAPITGGPAVDITQLQQVGGAWPGQEKPAAVGGEVIKPNGAPVDTDEEETDVPVGSATGSSSAPANAPAGGGNRRHQSRTTAPAAGAPATTTTNPPPSDK